jgi:pyrroloquinoline quinone biosynthesis protein B
MRFKVLGGSARAPWQGTVALAADEARPWLLLNLSGGVASRLDSEPGFGIDAQQPVLLTDAQIDQVAGLISLRGGAPIDLYATPSVFENLTTTLPVLPELERLCGVHWHMVAVAGDRRVAGFQVRGQEQLAFTAYDTGPAPDGCLGDPGSPAPGHSIAIEVRERASGRRAVFARGIGAMALESMGALDGVDCLLVDPGSTADAGGALVAWMATLAVPRRVMLGGPTAALQGLGIEAPHDGQDIIV